MRRWPRWTALLLLISLVLGSCATGSGSGFAREADRERKAQAKDKDKESKDGEVRPVPVTPTITIKASPPQAQIFVNDRLVGAGRVTLDSAGFGQRLTIRIQAPSYRPRTIFATLWGQTETIEVSLEPILGTVLVVGEGLQDAKIALDGVTGLKVGPNPVLIGDHRLTVRRFGYQEQTLKVFVEEAVTTTVPVTLVPAAFDLTDLRSDRPRFNPDSAAVAARIQLSFRATAPGQAHLVLTNLAGQELARWDYPDLTTWDHVAEWNGRDPEGRELPDGRYLFTLTGGPTPGQPTMERSLTVSIDRTLIDLDRPSLGPAPGLLWVPTPEVLSPGTLQVSVLGMGHRENGLLHAPVSSSLRVSPAWDWEVAGQLTARLWSETDLNSMYGTFALKRRIPFDSPDFRVAGVFGGTLATYVVGKPGIPPTDFLTTFPAIRALLPASWTWGKWTIMVAPEIDWSWWSPSTAYENAFEALEGPRFWAYGRFGLAYEPGPFSLAFSAAVRSRTFEQGAGILTPVQTGFEARWPLPNTPLTLTAYLAASAYTTVDYAWYGGLGFSLLLPPSLTLDLARQVLVSP